jgi:hypothetical protein
MGCTWACEALDNMDNSLQENIGLAEMAPEATNEQVSL